MVQLPFNIVDPCKYAHLLNLNSSFPLIANNISKTVFIKISSSIFLNLVDFAQIKIYTLIFSSKVLF